MAKNPFQESGDEEIRLNLTPMIDAVFLLLIFFMVTTVFTQSHQLKIILPTAVNYDRLKEKKLNLSISTEGQLEMNGQMVRMGELTDLLEREKNRTVATSLIIKADAKTPHGFVIDAMEVANRVGIEKISVETDKTRDTARQK